MAVVADVLAPHGARTSAATALTKFDVQDGRLKGLRRSY